MADTNLIEYHRTGDILKDTEEIVDAARKRAYQSVNVLLVQRNWLIGRRIAEEELSQSGRAEYGLEVIKSLSKSLTISKLRRKYIAISNLGDTVG